MLSAPSLNQSVHQIQKTSKTKTIIVVRKEPPSYTRCFHFKSKNQNACCISLTWLVHVFTHVASPACHFYMLAERQFTSVCYYQNYQRPSTLLQSQRGATSIDTRQQTLSHSKQHLQRYSALVN